MVPLMGKKKEHLPEKIQLKPARFLDPKSDLVFKKIFGQHPNLVISFLNGILPLANDELIQSIEYLPSEQVPRIPTLKNTVVDVKCTDQKNRIFIVEMQLNWTLNFAKRLIFGTAKAYVQQVNKGEDFISLCPVYGIAIIIQIFDSTPEWFHHYQTINVKDSKKVLPGLELIFLELPKFKPQTSHHCKMGILWLRFLKEINEEMRDVPEEFMKYPELTQAMQLTQESAYTAAELDTYDKYWDAIRVENTIQRDAEEKGRREGKLEGREEGRQEGSEEAKIVIALKLNEQGCDLKMISCVTGFSIKFIKSLIHKKDGHPSN